MTFCAILTCNQEGVTKILRKEVNNCPVRAVRGMVHRLQTDTAILFSASPCYLRLNEHNC